MAILNIIPCLPNNVKATESYPSGLGFVLKYSWAEVILHGIRGHQGVEEVAAAGIVQFTGEVPRLNIHNIAQ